MHSEIYRIQTHRELHQKCLMHIGGLPPNAKIKPPFDKQLGAENQDKPG